MKSNPIQDLFNNDMQRQRDIDLGDGYVPKPIWPKHLICVIPGCNNLRRPSKNSWFNTCETCAEDKEKLAQAIALGVKQRRVSSD